MLAFASYNIGEDSDNLPIEIKEPEPVIEKKPTPVTKPEGKDQKEKSIYSLFPEGSERKIDLGNIFDNANESNDIYPAYNLSVESYLDGDISTNKCDNSASPQMQIFCDQPLDSDLPLADKNPYALDFKIGNKDNISYNSDCLIQGKNSDKTPAGIVDNTKCLGGYDFSTGSGGDVKIKLRGTMTYDPDADTTIDQNFGVCPEGDLSKCAGVEIGIEINY